MGAKISKHYSSSKSQPNVFKLLLNFLPNGPHKTVFGIFEILKIEILNVFFFIFVNMGPSRSKNFKTLLLLQIAAKNFETCSEFATNGPHKTMWGIFGILSFPFLTILFRKFPITIVAYGEIKKPQLFGKRVIAEQNGMQFGTRG